MNDKKKKPIRWYINATLFLGACCTPILMIILLIIGNTTEKEIYIILGIAICPILSIVAVPNAIIYAVKSNKFKDEFESRKRFLDKYYVCVDDEGKYYKIIIFDLIKKTIISSVLIVTLVFGLLYLSCNFYINDGPNHLNDRPIASRLLRPSYKVEGGIFLVTMLLLLFGLPSIAYIIALNINKIVTFCKNKYFCYKVIVENIDLSDNLYIKSTKDTNRNKFKSLEKHKKNIFKQYKCLGISKEKALNTEVIMILIPGDSYLLKK